MEWQAVYIEKVFIPGDQYISSSLIAALEDHIVFGVPADINCFFGKDDLGFGYKGRYPRDQCLELFPAYLVFARSSLGTSRYSSSN